MDWFTWLSKTGLDPSLVYQYGVAFAQNELDRDDLPYFNHEFLQSMGISIAKHRLEILKLTRRDAAARRPRHVCRMLIAAVKRTRQCLSKYIREWARRDDSSVLALVPRRSCSRRRHESAAKRSNNSKRTIGTQLLLTNGSPLVLGSSSIESFASPNFDERDFERLVDGGWSPAVEDIRWDTMFWDLKPT